MKFRLSETLSIESPAKKSDVIEMLKNKIEPIKYFRWFYTGNGFEGKVYDDGFKIQRIISGRNSFLPIIIGKIKNTSTGSIIHIKMRLHYLVTAFMSIWLSMAGLFFILGISMYLQDNDSIFIALSALAMFFFGAILTWGVFWYEVNKQGPMIINIFSTDVNSTKKSANTNPAKHTRKK